MLTDSRAAQPASWGTLKHLTTKRVDERDGSHQEAQSSAPAPGPPSIILLIKTSLSLIPARNSPSTPTVHGYGYGLTTTAATFLLHASPPPLQPSSPASTSSTPYVAHAQQHPMRGIRVAELRGVGHLIPTPPPPPSSLPNTGAEGIATLDTLQAAG